VNAQRDAARIMARNCVTLAGSGSMPMIFAHGLGSDQRVWRLMTPYFEKDYRVITFDHVGSGRSDISAYRRAKYGALNGYADDLLEIVDALDIERMIYVGHSVSANIGVLAANRHPERFAALVMLGPSPRFLNDENYRGGYSQQDIDEALSLLDSNQDTWCQQLMMHALSRDQAEELAQSLCNANRAILRHFAQVAFGVDVRREVARCPVRTLILQSRNDAIVPVYVGDYLHRTMPKNTYVVLEGLGHYPQLTAPAQTTTVIREFLDERHRE
jgi:sigma-B regulation protein RsbQ